VALVRRARDAGDEFFPGFVDVVEIGVGRIAAVFAAREVATDRTVALKLLAARRASPAAVESFAREAAALALVGSHPNVVTLLSSFAAADGRPVLALERCRGLTADPDHPLAPPDAVIVGSGIARALAAAHRAGVVHCDVKPANILQSDYGDPVLIDFGAASVPEHPLPGLVDLASAHVAPELRSGGPAGPAVDVYGLASTLFDLVAGGAAHDAGSRALPFTTAGRHAPVRPPLAAGVPPAFAALIAEAMSLDPADRPTAAEFADRLS
jgi:serine/threonine protein kinase